MIIVDDNEFLRVGLESALESENDIEVAGLFGEAAAAVAEVEELNPGVVLLSVSMPDMNGLEACRKITGAATGSRVVMLASKPTDEEAIEAIRAGASGYLPKNAPLADLVRAVRSSRAGELFLATGVVERTLSVLPGPEPGAGAARLTDRLTDRENEVLVLVAAGQTNKEIAARLGLSAFTVRNHVGRVFTKLKLSKRAQLGAYAVRLGILDDSGCH